MKKILLSPDLAVIALIFFFWCLGFGLNFHSRDNVGAWMCTITLYLGSILLPLIFFQTFSKTFSFRSDFQRFVVRWSALATGIFILASVVATTLV